MSAAQPITIPYSALINPPASLAADIAAAFGSGPECLGIIVVTGLPPEFKGMRERLLRVGEKFAGLAWERRERYADGESRWSFGWSWGKEIMNGKPDTLKGSYYANPLLDKPDVSDELREKHPEYYKGNIWPDEEREKEIAGFQAAFKELGKFIFDTGLLLAEACESFVAPNLQITGASSALAGLLRSSNAHKARLLHYFPAPPSGDGDEGDDEDSWCGWHLDHSLITGLVSAMYLFHPSGAPVEPIPNPHEKAGLYIRSRSGALNKVAIPADALAFQTGEALELSTGGRLRATPHCVRGGGKGSMTLADGREGEVSRETFAFFMQPDVQAVIGANGETFGQFTHEVLNRHYEKVGEGAQAAANGVKVGA